MVHVLEEVGYHVVIIQEAWVQQLSQLDRDKWTFKERAGQYVGARRPSWVECVGGQHVSKKVWWAAFTVHFDEPRAGRSKLGILSLHLCNDALEVHTASRSGRSSGSASGRSSGSASGRSSGSTSGRPSG